MLWNKACEELTGFPASDMIGTADQWRAFYDHRRPCLADIVIDGATDALPALYSRHARSVLRSQGLQAEGWYKNMNGRDRYISFDAAPIYDSKGNLSVVIETLLDITAQKLMEEERQKLIDELQNTIIQVSRSQKEWQDTFDSITDMIFIVKDDFTILRANMAFANTQGLHPREAEGKKCYEIIQDYFSACEECCHEAVLCQNKPMTTECLVPKTDKILDLSIYPYFSPEGDIIGSIHIARDVTLEKEKERKLIASERLASLGQLSAGMAHEINNPINFIMASAELLLEIWGGVLKVLQKHYEEHGDFVIGGFYFSKDRERITQLFSGIAEGSLRIKNIVNNLTFFTRSKVIEPEEAVDMNKVMTSSLMIVEPQIKKYTDSFLRKWKSACRW
jgi:PAS domain S-box-containing protein